MTIDYETLERGLMQADASYGAAECQGLLTGILCAQGQAGLAAFIDGTLAAAGHAPQDLRSLLTELFNTTLRMLNDPQCGYYPLLPGDEAPLALRVQMLGEWSQGLIMGLRQAGISTFDALPGDCPELLEDVAEIAGAEAFSLEDPEEDEKAYTELVEFVHAAAMLLYEELQAGAPDAGESTVH